MWFGGSCGAPSARMCPETSRPIWPEVAGLWDSGDWPQYERQTARHRERRIAVFGPCAATPTELQSLAASGVPDDVAWRWPGSYTVVQLDPATTTVWTDLGCAWPIYTVTVRGGTMWASSSLLLASLTGYRVDLGQVTDRLIDPDLSESVVDRSWFHGVGRVPPGRRLTLTRDGAITVQRVWNPRQERHRDYAVWLRSELAAAVHLRADTANSPSSDLSGGFDSTALALLAGERLSPQGRRIVGVTVHPAGTTTGGDLDYARTAGRHPGIRHVWLPLSDEHAPYQRMDRLAATDEPAPSAVSHAYLSAQLRWLADELGCDLHMTGDGGDGLLLTRASQLADLARTGRLLRALRETALWAHVRKKSWWQVFRSAKSNASRPWVTRAGTGQASRVDHLVTSGTRLQREILAAITAAGRTARSDAQIAERCGINLHNPYFDSRVIDACLTVPTTDLPGPAHYKPLLAQAMGDLYPPQLARRTTKGDACADHYGGLRRALPELAEFVAGRLAELGLVDVRRLRQALTTTAAGLSNDLYPVETAVSVEAWLRTVAIQPETKWRPASVEAAR